MHRRGADALAVGGVMTNDQVNPTPEPSTVVRWAGVPAIAMLSAQGSGPGDDDDDDEDDAGGGGGGGNIDPDDDEGYDDDDDDDDEEPLQCAAPAD
jgi:hypothetical protein